MIAICDYVSEASPSVEFFKNANVLISKQQASRDIYEDYPLIIWCIAEHFNPHVSNLNIVGSLETTRKFNYAEHRGFVHWKFISYHIENQHQLVTKHGQPKMTVKLKSLRERKHGYDMLARLAMGPELFAGACARGYSRIEFN